jgi:hypothetical protein
LQSFETEVLTQEENLAGLAALNRELLAKAEAIASPWRESRVSATACLLSLIHCSAVPRLL